MQTAMGTILTSDSQLASFWYLLQTCRGPSALRSCSKPANGATAWHKVPTEPDCIQIDPEQIVVCLQEEGGTIMTARLCSVCASWCTTRALSLATLTCVLSASIACMPPPKFYLPRTTVHCCFGVCGVTPSLSNVTLPEAWRLAS